METKAPLDPRDARPPTIIKCGNYSGHLDLRGRRERRANKGSQDALPSVQDPQAPVVAQGAGALKDPKEHGLSTSRGPPVGEEGPAMQAIKE